MSFYGLRSLLQLTKICYSSSQSRKFCSSSNLSHFDRIGFIGLGNMGSRMADNLIKAGYNIVIYDVNHNAVNSFADKGILSKKSPAEVAESSDVVITMLPSSSHVLDVFTGSEGVLCGGDGIRPRLYIDCSTIDPQTSRKLSKAISDDYTKKNNIDSLDAPPAVLDAPVSGGVLAAKSGTLTFMVGGSEEAFEAAKPLFLSMGKSAIYCGGSGNGSAAKICNNLALAISMVGVSEAFSLGQYLGISARTLTKVFNSSTARCWSSDTYNPVPGVMDGVPSSRNYDGGFACKLMAKDLGLAAESAKEVGFECPLTSQAQGIFSDLCKKGHASEDFSSVFRHFYSGKDEF